MRTVPGERRDVSPPVRRVPRCSDAPADLRRAARQRTGGRTSPARPFPVAGNSLAGALDRPGKADLEAFLAGDVHVLHDLRPAHVALRLDAGRGGLFLPVLGLPGGEGL